MDLLKPSYATGYAKNASQSAHPNLWDGLVGAWMPSLGVTGETLRDVSGNGNHGTLTNMDAATDWVATSKGLALDFDGNDDYVELGSISGKNPLTLDGNLGGTIVCVAKTIQGDQFQRLFDKSSGPTASNGYALTLDPNFGINGQINGRWAYTGVTYNYNRFYHFAWTFFGSDWRIYQDGERKNLTVFTGPLWSNIPQVTANARIGTWNHAAARELKGNIASLSIYNRALSASEIKQLYVDSLAPFRTKKRTVVRVPAAIPAATKVGSIKKPTTIIKPSYQSVYARNASESENPQLWDGLVGAWMPSFGVTGETLRDVSGNGNHGTLTNMDAASDWVVSKSKQSIEISGGNSQHINISDSLTNSNMPAIGSSDHTIISNVYNLDIAEEDIVGSNGIGAGNILLMIVASRVRCHVWRSSGVSVVDSSQTVGTGKWMQVVQRAKFGQTLDVYVNGRKSNSTALPNLPFDKGAGFLLGARYPGYRGTFLGSVSNTLAYNRALSPTEIKQLYVDSLAPFRTKKRTVVRVPAAVPTPSATYHPLRSLAHPLEQ